MDVVDRLVRDVLVEHLELRQQLLDRLDDLAPDLVLLAVVHRLGLTLHQQVGEHAPRLRLALHILLHLPLPLLPRQHFS